jgi:hypothetical protein
MAIDQKATPPTYAGEHIRLVGITDDGRPIVGGAFGLLTRKNCNLAHSLRQADKWDWVISVACFVADAMEAGWSKERAIKAVRKAVQAVGAEYTAGLDAELEATAAEWQEHTTDTTSDRFIESPAGLEYKARRTAMGLEN